MLTAGSDCIYHFCEGHDATQHAAFGEAAHIAVTLRMHEEASYEGLDPIESEVRRRTFWLLFDGESRSRAEGGGLTCRVCSGQVHVYRAGVSCAAFSAFLTSFASSCSGARYA